MNGTAIRWGKGALALWAIALLLSAFPPPSSADTPNARVVMLER